MDLKAKIGRCRRWLGEGFVQMLRRHPVEALIVAVGCVCCLAAYEADWSDEALTRLWGLPLAFAAALAAGNLAGCGPWRRVYWAVWAPFVPLMLWSGFPAWIGSEPGIITLLALAPLAVLLSRRAVSNERFVCDGVIWLRAGVLAAFFANVALGLFGAIFFSATYIFGLEGRWIEHVWIYALILTETFAGPALFLILYDRWKGAECAGSRVFAGLLNYVVTPAVLIYTGILYLYMVKIVLMWSLPEGGVAYLVFGFTLCALLVKALQSLLPDRTYDWFFDRFSLISLPTQLLFWIGAVRRVGEYGLTEPRVWLLVCGGLMTLCVLLFLARRTGRYLFVGLAGFVCLAALAYVPSLHPERLALRSQLRRAVHTARQLDVLAPDGSLRLDAFAADSLRRSDYRRLYEALEYVAAHDSGTFERFGADMEQIRGAVPAALHDYVVYGYDYNRGSTFADRWFSIHADSRRITLPVGYRTLYAGMETSYYSDRTPKYRFESDTLRIDFGASHAPFRIPAPVLLERQLARAGLEALPTEEGLQAAADSLTIYREEGLLILFSDLQFQWRDSTLRLDGVSVEAVLTR
ncbi:DUF4153 domain-containing protein [Alistipes sp.]|uniref:DUF4153 domain-containing protein n=1 Tax=Alistipes sp. TaxID=1872444 RepID=UPI003AF02D72